MNKLRIFNESNLKLLALLREESVEVCFVVNPQRKYHFCKCPLGLKQAHVCTLCTCTHT